MPHTRSPPPRSTALRQSSPRTPAPHRAAPAVGPPPPSPAPPPPPPPTPPAIHPGRLPIQHLRREVLRRPVEFTQYTSAEFRDLCDAHGVLQSMGRTGVCWDNALAESFFATYKLELIDLASWPTRARARSAS